MNAVRYGSAPIVGEATDDGEQMTIVVSNERNPIPQHALRTLFDPLTGPARPTGAERPPA